MVWGSIPREMGKKKTDETDPAFLSTKRAFVSLGGSTRGPSLVFFLDLWSQEIKCLSLWVAMCTELCWSPSEHVANR